MLHSTHRRGLVNLLFATFSYSIMAVFVKLAGTDMPSQQIVFLRSGVGCLLIVFLAWRRGISLKGHNYGLLAQRALFGFFGMSAYFYTLTVIPIADSTILLYTNPLFTILLAPYLLREANTGRQWSYSTLGFIGVFMVIQPTLKLDPLATVVGIAGAVATALAYITVRRMRDSEHELVIIFYFMSFSVLASFPGISYDFVMPGARVWWYIAGVGVFTVLGQLFMTRGLHRVRATQATNVSYSNVLFTTFWGILIWGNWPDVLAVAGVLFIVGSIVLMNRRASS